MRPTPALLDALRGLRLAPHHARPSLGQGERRSDTHGAGLEFTGHRPYREGDEVRHIDARLMARLGQPFVRQYAVDRQLSVVILLDTSPSMSGGSPNRLSRAYELAQLLGFIALESGDGLRVCSLSASKPQWSPLLRGIQQIDTLFSWLEVPRKPATVSFGRFLSSIVSDIPPRSLVVMISDWLDADAENGLRVVAQCGHELVVIQLASPLEIEPEILGRGRIVLIEPESTDSIEIMLDAQTLQRYRAGFEERKGRLNGTATKAQGWYFFASSTTSASELINGDMRKAGLI